MPDRKMYILMLWPTKGAFQGINFTMLQLFRQYSPRGYFFLVDINKATILKGKALKQFTNQKRKLLASPWIHQIMRPINKRILLHRMSM